MSRLEAPWLGAPGTRAVMAALDAARPHASRFVGGCVRNTLLGQPIDDIDIATALTPQDVLAAAAQAGLTAIATGIEHGTVTLIAAHAPFEVTTLRRDVSTDGRRATVAFTDDWREDAARRDFTINALYGEVDGALHDPTGAGLADLAAGRVRFIGEARTRIREDYLRILRFFRFSAWYARVGLDGEGLAACAALHGGLAALSAERVWKELKKLLQAPDPGPALAAMAETGVLGALAPEMRDLARLTALAAIERALAEPPDALLRAAALLPDDPETAHALARRLKLSNAERDRLGAALAPKEPIVAHLSPPAVRRAVYAGGRQSFEDRARLAWAGDPDPRSAPDWRALLAQGRAWTPPVLPLGGEAVMAAGVPAGPAVGAVLRALEEWWVAADFPNDKNTLLARLDAAAQAFR